MNLREPWSIGPVEIPTRLVLAPMAGVSVQAFRRQGRRYGAGLVCSEMVSCAGIEHRNERTLGYLRVGGDEHPLAIQVFGSDPAVMADAARMVERAGADLVDINFGCPVRKVTKTGAGATLLEDPERACRIVDAVASAVSIPVSVKMRRSYDDTPEMAANFYTIFEKAIELGHAAVTVHGRTVEQKRRLVQAITDAVRTEPYAHDWWPRLVMRRRAGEALPLPDAVVAPRDRDGVVAVVRWAAAIDVPFQTSAAR